MQKQLVRQLESQERRRVEEAKAALMLEYEDLLWRAVELYASEADLLRDGTVQNILTLLGKSIKDFVADFAGIKQRIEMLPQIEASLAAEAETADLNASLAQIDAEAAAAEEAFEARRRPLRQQLRDCKRRLAETAPARQHYRQTAPDWLKKQIAATGERILRLEKRQRSKPVKPTPPGQSLAYQDTEYFAKREQRYADRMARHQDELANWQEEEDARKPTIALLECELAALKSLVLQLRPTMEDDIKDE